MRLLLDTHAFLWFVLGDPQLSATALAQILDPANIKLVPVRVPTSVWKGRSAGSSASSGSPV
jgi:PIN domain nuclease of toxin-antitoxin system